jgi:hypothetical protein
MADPSKIDRKKVYIGVFFLCVAAGIMLAEGEDSPEGFRILWMLLSGVGVFFYLWGRFFSRGPE